MSSANGGHISDNNFSDDSNSVVFSQPSTPVKSSLLYTCNAARTPDHKQQLVADVSSFYFASIRASASKTLNETPTPTKLYPSASNFAYSSNSNSPIKFNSPKFVVNADDYVSQRDNLSFKLLRSPAFKLTSTVSATVATTNFSANFIEPTPIVIKSFSSRFDSVHSKHTSSIETPKHTTPTEEEFMELLFKNNHLPSNPEFLIGRHMGLDELNIVSELNKRGMTNILNRIFGFLSNDALDLVHAASVDREWRYIVKSLKSVNRKRVEFLREQKAINEFNKENSLSRDDKLTKMSLADRRNLFRKQARTSSLYASTENSGAAAAGVSASLDEVSGVSQIVPIDLNVLYNRMKGYNKSDSLASAFPMVEADKHSESRMIVDEVQMAATEAGSNVTSKANNVSSLLLLSSEVNEAGSSILNSIDNSYRSQLSTNFTRISIDDKKEPETSQIFRTKLPRTLSKDKSHLELLNNATTSSSSAINIVNSSPKFIAKNLKMSPAKKHAKLIETPFIGNASRPPRVDLIGSKSSKRNLKRL